MQWRRARVKCRLSIHPMRPCAALIRPMPGVHPGTGRARYAGSTRAAQYLNPGILPNGSSRGSVSRFAAASR